MVLWMVMTSMPMKYVKPFCRCGSSGFGRHSSSEERRRSTYKEENEALKKKLVAIIDNEELLIKKHDGELNEFVKLSLIV